MSHLEAYYRYSIDMQGTFMHFLIPSQINGKFWILGGKDLLRKVLLARPEKSHPAGKLPCLMYQA
jgi:hypothetical protein